MNTLNIHEHAEYAYSIIKKICEEVGPGCPGSPQERARAMIVKDELEKVTNNVAFENFTFAPNAFLGWYRLSGGLIIFSLVCFYLSLLNTAPLAFAILAFGVALLIFLIMEFEFLYSREFTDRFYKKRGSTNVIGRIGPKEGDETKRILIFSGHHDSALQFTWLRHLKSGFYVTVMVTAVAVMVLVVSTAIHLISVAFSLIDAWNVSFVTVLSWTVFPAGIIFGMFFTERGHDGGRVPGAVDNLSGVTLAIAVARVLKAYPDIHPPYTEIRIISFGAEEASVRGSRAYVHRHLAELKDHDAVCINFESIVHPEIIIYKSDLNGSLKFDLKTVATVAEAAKQAGVPYSVKPFSFGGAGTDALSFGRAGLKATSLCSLKPRSDLLSFYHQEFDTPDKVNLVALQNVLQIVIEYLKAFNH
nr:M28 family peptidase [Candidatus Sigynarchaeota archaeon]